MLIALSFVFLYALPFVRAQETHSHSAHEKLGKVSFPISCAPAVQEQFDRGVALLHSFAYAAAQDVFHDVAERDPQCAMAHWGAALSYFRQLWDPPILPATIPTAQKEIERAQEIRAGTERERQFIYALSLVYQDAATVPYHTRAANYELAMKDLASKNQSDVEAQVFYALALLANESPADRTHAKQKQAAELLEPLSRTYPQHPGIPHYLIHAYDNAELAPKGLTAARAYSQIAPSAPHALHMPSHIFTRLGLWEDSIKSNLAARDAAHQQGDTGEELHAMDYLVYAYLQAGRDDEAKQIVQQLENMPQVKAGDFKIGYASAAMPVRYAVERRQWADAAAIVPPTEAPPHVVAIAVWARGLGRARTGRAIEAQKDVDKLRELEGQLRTAGNDYWATQVAILGREVAAWSAQAENKPDEAVALMRKAADEEDAIEKLPVTPGPIVPAREQLGDLLLEQKLPDQARKEFKVALVNAPGRRGALQGKARAAEASAQLTKLDGLILDAATGKPLAGAKVSLCEHSVEKVVARCALAQTDPEGKFIFSGSAAGRYYLMAEAAGYLRDNLILDGSGSVEFELAQSETRSVRLKLLPEATISGHLLDEEGQPIPGITVAAIRDGFNFGRRYLSAQHQGGPTETSSEGNGSFRIGQLQPGKYYLQAYLGPFKKVPDSFLNKGYVPIYYPNASDLERAMVLCVAVGEERQIDFHLRPRSVFYARGKLEYSANFNRQFEPLIAIRDDKGDLVHQWRRRYDPHTRSFTLGPLAPGSYDAEFTTGIYSDDLIAKKKFPLTNTNLNGLVVSLRPRFTVHARVSFPPGFRPHTPYSLRLRLEPDGFAPMDDSGVPVVKEGEVKLENLEPGHYSLYVFTEDPVYVRTARLGQRDVLRNGLFLEGPTTSRLDITLASANAEIKGTVAGVSEKPAVGADVKLLADGSGPPYVVKSIIADQNGRFSFSAVPPGAYDLIALDEIIRDSELGPTEFVQVKRWASRVEVGEASSASVALQAAAFGEASYPCNRQSSP